MIYYVAQLSVFSFVIWLHIDKASEKKRNICRFKKFCVFLLFRYIWSHTFGISKCVTMYIYYKCVTMYIYFFQETCVCQKTLWLLYAWKLIQDMFKNNLQHLIVCSIQFSKIWRYNIIGHKNTPSIFRYLEIQWSKGS